MKLILFILAIAFCTASPTYRGLRSLQGSDLIVEAPSQDLIGLDDLPGWSVDQSDDDFFDLNGVALQEEMTFPNEEETLPEEPEQPEESEQSDQPEEELLTQVRNTPELNSIFSFGVDTVLSQGVEDGKIPNVEFQVTGISALSSNVGNDGTLYTFGCNLANSNGSSIIDLNFTAYVDTATGRNILSSYSYVINTTTVTTPTNPSENNYQECSEEEIQTEVVPNAFNSGVAPIIALRTQAGKIPVSEFRVVSVENVWKQNLNSKTYYRCQVVLENQNKVTLNTTFTVIYNPANKETTMSSYEYTVREVETTPVNNGTNANNTDGFVGLSASEIESAEVQAVLAFGTNKIIESGYNKTKIPVSDYSITKINSVAKKNSTKNRTIYKCDVELEDVKKVLITTQFTITLNTVTQQLTLGSWSYNITNIRNPPTNNTDYTELNATEIQNADIQALLAFGTNEIIKSGNSKGKIPVSDWSITKINSVSKRDATNKKDIVYRCDVELQDAQKAVIKALFTVTFTTATKAMDMGSWSYTINLPPKYNNTTPNTNTTNPTTPNNTDTTNTTNPTTPTNNTNTTTPTTPNNTTNNTNPTPSDYTQLTAEEIQNAEVQAALAFGLNQILESGYNKSRIPVSQYSISKINSVGRKNYTKNRTIYKCDIEASDAKKAVIKAQFFVTVKTTTQALDMGSWNYTIHVPPGYNNNNNTNTNTTNPTTPNTTTPTNPNTPTNNTNTTTPTIPTTPNNTNTSTPTTPTTPNNTNPAPSDFTQLTTEEIQNAEVQAALAFGINQIIESAYNKSKIPVSQYSISKVNSVSRKNQAQKTTYKCDIEASGVNKVVIKAQFSVTVNTTTQAFAMGVWNYSVQFPNRNNTNTNTTTGAGNTTKPAETPNTTTPVNNNTTQTPAPTTPSNTTQTTNNTNSNTNTNTNTTAENFTELTASEIQNNAEVQAVLTYGSNQVIQKGIEKSKIPQSEYKISKVVSVAKSQGTGKNTYKCNVELEGANKVGVKAQYNVSIKPNTTEMTLSSYVYNVNNLPK